MLHDKLVKANDLYYVATTQTFIIGYDKLGKWRFDKDTSNRIFKETNWEK